MTDLLETILANQARELGLVAIGFAAAGLAPHHARFARWLAAGNHGAMKFMERHADLRTDPRRLAPGTRTVIMAAARYPRHPQPGHGFAAHTWGRDYHTVLRQKLRVLAATLRREGARLCRICVDSAPLAERDWAVSAGLGWRGRQGQIVRTDSGCCLLLGALLTDIGLRPSPPYRDRCGRCRKCLDACPTGALLPDGTVDARRCIACLTIEYPGAIPADLQPRMGTALFGCDRCTAVCPWNRFGADRMLPEFNADRPLPEAGELLAMDEQGFAARFAGTVVMRTGLARMRRNAQIAIKNERSIG